MIPCIDEAMRIEEETGSLLNDKFEFINHDIRNPFDISCDLIINLACPASPVKYQEDKVFTAETCALGIINVCNNATKYNSHIIHASTSEVYGDPLVNPQSEDYFGNVNINGIRSCYDEGKRCAETLFMDYKREHDLDIRIVRIFNTYGPNMTKNDGRVISNFILQALNNENITIYGDGLQTRSFQYIDDLIEGMIKMMHSNFVGPVNLGNPVELSMKDLANKIIKITNAQIEAIEREYYQRYNSGITQWQQNQY